MSANIETTRTKDKLLISIPTKNMKPEEIDDFGCRNKFAFHTNHKNTHKVPYDCVAFCDPCPD